MRKFCFPEAGFFKGNLKLYFFSIFSRFIMAGFIMAGKNDMMEVISTKSL